MSSFVLPVSTVIFAVFFLILSLALPDVDSGVGPGGWPATILILMLLAGSALFVKVYRNAKEEKRKPENSEVEINAEAEVNNSEQTLPYPYRHWIVLGIICLYFILMRYFGFLVTTPFFIVFIARVLGMRNWFLIILISIFCTAFVVGLFISVFSLSLPQGVGLFRNLSAIFY